MELTADDLRAISFLVRHHRDRRLPVPPQVAFLAQRVEAEIRCAMSAYGHEPHIDTEKSVVGTKEAAQRLGCTERHVRRIAKQLGGQLISGCWVIPEGNL